jgi:hypothetical protein
MPNGQFVIAVVAEDRLAFENATIIADKVGSSLTHQYWDDPDSFVSCRLWMKHPKDASSRDYLPLSELRQLREIVWGNSSRRFHGHFGGHDLRPAIAVEIFANLDEPPQIVIISLDSDRDTGRTAALRTGASAVGATRPEGSPTVVLALANPEHEAWRIAAFRPSTDVERGYLDEICRELSFDPTREPHRMVSASRNAGRDVKAIHHRLMDETRSAQALAEAAIEELEGVSKSCGLPTYVTEIRSALIEIDPSFQ